MNKTTMSSQSADRSCCRVVEDGSNLRAGPESGEPLLVGSSVAIRRLRTQIERIAPHFRCVLIRGERGTGKELVARMLHANAKPDGTFLLLDSETIEARRQAQCAIGRYLKGAEPGTLFLDCVDRLSLSAQDWLLEMLGWDESARLSKKDQPGIEMRVIASTVEDLRALASAGRFRQALYYRLSTVEIALPPLRARIEDVPLLAGHFLDRFARLHGKSVLGVAEEAMSQLQKQRWPRNVRELSEVIEDGVLRCDANFVEMHHLVFAEERGAKESAPDAGVSVRLEDVVERHVLGVLKGCGGNKLRAAEMLGISRSTLYRMLESGGSAAVVR